MKDLKHTPGPWKFSTQTHFSGGAPYSESVYVTMGDQTLTIGCHTGTPHQDTLIATAKIIAAAPELLEALMDSHNQSIGAYDLKSCGHDFFCTCPSEKTVKAIQKATA